MASVKRLESSQYPQNLPISLGRLAHQLQCLKLDGFHVPYHRNIAMFMSRYSQLSHLKLNDFTLYSFEDLRKIVYALPKLHDLELSNGDTVSQNVSSQLRASGLMANNCPCISRLRTSHVEEAIMVPLSRWIASTEVFKYCKELYMEPDDPEEGRMWFKPILYKLAPTLITLHSGVSESFPDIGM